MHFFFGDDSRQTSPTRDGMGALAAVGGIVIDGSRVKSLENQLEEVCINTGFPKGEEFKWSPGRELWMRSNLIGEQREDFFERILKVALDCKVQALFVANDTTCSTATRVASHDEDVSTTLLERVHHRTPIDDDGYIVIVDRPGGDRRDEDQFLMTCLEQLQQGTRYVKHDRIAINVVSTPSKLVRCLQLADVITSCCLARVSGEDRYSPKVFSMILPMFREEFGRRGGCSFKIHPDFKYANLYHWLLGDSHFVRNSSGSPMPLKNRPYSTSATSYRA